MQKNLITFFVLAFGIMLGWTVLMNWLRTGEFQVVAAEGIEVEGAELHLKVGEEVRGKIDLSNESRRQGRLPIGEYDLVLEGNADGLRIAPDHIEIKRGQVALVDLVKAPPRKIVKADAQAKKIDHPDDGKHPDGNQKPVGDKRPDVARRPDDKKPDDKKPDDKKPADRAVAGDGHGDAQKKGEPAGHGKAVRQWVALGSANPDDPYRMLVVLDSAGAAVERIELNHGRYRDIAERSGYLGPLAATDAPRDGGATVHVVGRGTPAHEVGMRPGDVIVALDGEPVRTAGELSDRLAATRPEQTVELSLVRDGKPLTVSPTLVRPGLLVVRPEVENAALRKFVGPDGRGDPLSFLLTLSRVDDRKLEPDPTNFEELAGLDLRTANWEVLPRNADDSTAVRFRRVLDKQGLEVTKTYRLAEGPGSPTGDDSLQAYHLTLSVEIKNLTDAKRQVAYQLDGPTGLPTEGAWYVPTGLRDYIVGYREGEGITPHTAACRDLSTDPKTDASVKLTDNQPPAVAYIGAATQYFAVALIPDREQETAFSGMQPLVVGKIDADKKRFNLTDVSSRLVSHSVELDKRGTKGDSLVHEFTIFAGPKKPALLAEYHLESLIDYGWFGWVARPMQLVLHTFHGLVGNYGLAIIMLTVVVRLGMFPLSRKQALSAQKMQELQPEMKRIQEQHKTNMEARNKATQDLFRKHNYNPLGGCLLVFFQLPIFIGLYRSLQMDVELWQAPLVSGMRWCSNLAAPDMILDWSAWAPNVLQHGWFILPALGPYFNVLPIITVILFIVQQKMFTPPPTNEQAAMQQKIMSYMMIVIGVMFYTVASGLCIYFIASSLWGLAERKLLPKMAAAPSATASGGAVAAPTSNPSGNGAAAARRAKRKQKRGR